MGLSRFIRGVKRRKGYDGVISLCRQSVWAGGAPMHYSNAAAAALE